VHGISLEQPLTSNDVLVPPGVYAVIGMQERLELGRSDDRFAAGAWETVA
jgi:hypothetical protein